MARQQDSDVPVRNPQNINSQPGITGSISAATRRQPDRRLDMEANADAWHSRPAQWNVTAHNTRPLPPRNWRWGSHAQQEERRDAEQKHYMR